LKDDRERLKARRDGAQARAVADLRLNRLGRPFGKDVFQAFPGDVRDRLHGMMDSIVDDLSESEREDNLRPTSVGGGADFARYGQRVSMNRSIFYTTTGALVV